MLPGVWNLTGFDLQPLGNRQSGQRCDFLKRAAARYACVPDQLAKDLTGHFAAQESGARTRGGGGYKITQMCVTPERQPGSQTGPNYVPL